MRTNIYIDGNNLYRAAKECCLVEFLRDNASLKSVISPNENKCSILIRNKNIKIDFLNEHYHKFSKP